MYSAYTKWKLGDGQGRAAFSARALFLVLPVALALPAIAWSILPGTRWQSRSTGPVMAVVERGAFIHDITERGEVESASNVEVRCEVPNQSGSGTMILEIIPEGTYVLSPKVATSEDEAAQILESMKGSLRDDEYLGVQMEVVSDEIADPREFDGIITSIRTPDQARQAYRTILANVQKKIAERREAAKVKPGVKPSAPAPAAAVPAAPPAHSPASTSTAASPTVASAPGVVLAAKATTNPSEVAPNGVGQIAQVGGSTPTLDDAVAGSPIGFIEPTIDGIRVEQILVKLDQANLHEEYVQQQILCNTSGAAVTQALNAYDTAVIALEEYLKGTFVQEKQKLESQLFVAEEDLRKAQQFLVYSKTLLDKGYITPTQLEADDFAVQKAAKSRDSAKTELDVLQRYTQKKMENQLEADIKTAEAKLQSEQHSHQLDLDKLARVKGELEKCVIVAPDAGQVVFANESDRRSGTEIIIEEGAMARERQVLVRLPDPKRMQVVGKINEANVALVVAGQKALIRLDAFPDMELTGVVKKVNEYPAPTSWYGSNIKEYETTVAIDQTPEGLRPGLTAEVRIRVANLKDVLMVPVQAVFEHAGSHYCVAPQGEGLAARKVELGPTNDKVVVIRSGAEAGEKLALGAASYRDAVNVPEAAPAAQQSPGEPSEAAEGQPAVGDPGPAAADAQPGATVAPQSPAGQRVGPGAADAPGGSGAQRAPRGDPSQMIARLDRNGDGKIDGGELAALPEQMRAGMMAADANGDGSIDRNELLSAFQRMSAARGGPGGAAGVGGPRGGQPGAPRGDGNASPGGRP